MKLSPKIIFPVLLVLTLLFAVYLYPNFQNIAGNQAELDALVAEELGHRQNDSSLSYLTQHEKEDETLFWYVMQSNIDSDYRSYFVAKCKPLSGGKYQLQDIFTPKTYAKDILSIVWKTDYILVINNPDCRSIVQTDNNGNVIERIDLSAESYPYIYYHNSPLSIETKTSFLDAEGKEIS